MRQKKNLEEIASSLREEEWEQMDVPPAKESAHTEAFIRNIVTARKKKSFVPKLAVAACFLAVCVTAGIIWYNNKPGEANQSYTATKEATDNSHFIEEKNEALVAKSITLPDGSVVTLSSGAVIKYVNHFLPQKRDIYLTGEAVFEVAADAKRPFTVYCGDVATTALGTKFKVTSNQTKGNIDVALLEGKILVQSTHTNSESKKYYLLPGNQIQFNTTNHQFTFINVPIQDKSTDKLAMEKSEKEPLVADKKKATVTAATANEIKFSNEPLSQVLDKLARQYNVKIIYPTDKVKKINFIGTVSKTASLKKILSDIAAMNSFELVADSAQNRYTIR